MPSEHSALDDLKEGAARFLMQYSNSVYDSVSDQLKQQVAAALPDIALQYLQVHAQRGANVERKARYDPSVDWVELEHVTVDAEVDEDGWMMFNSEHQKLAMMALGLRPAGRASGSRFATLALAGVGTGLVALPLTASVTAIKAGVAVSSAAGGLGMRLAGFGPRPQYPSIGVPPWDRFAEDSVAVAGEVHSYRTWLPFEQALEGPEAKPPVILLLHGYSECGWDNHWQCSSGLGSLLQEWDFAESFPAVVVLPQLPRKPWDVQWWEGWKEPQIQDIVMSMLWQAVRTYGCDPRRICIVGESLGGEGAWQLAKRFPATFAGVAVTCGSLEPYNWHYWEWGSDPDIYDTVASVVRAPLWFCAGSEDPYVPIEHPQRLHAALRAARGENSWLSLALRLVGVRTKGEVVFKTYDGMGHEVWTRAYTEDDLLEWIFKQRL